MLANPTLVVAREADDYAYSAHLLGSPPVRHLNETQLRALVTTLRNALGPMSTESDHIRGLAIVREGPFPGPLTRFLQSQ